MDINYSIIIPHYDIPELLVRCLHSIPVREDIQVIVVDDCSPGSDEYLENIPELSRPYLEFYSTPKGGSAGRARNIGIEHAKGRWLIFIDSDDLFVQGAFDLLQSYIDEEADILYYNYKRVFSNDLTKLSKKWSNADDFIEYEITNDDTKFRYYDHPIWSKVIKKTLVDKYDIRCDETRYANDVGFSLKCGIHATNTKIINQALFLITERPGSLACAISDGGMTSTEYRIRLGVMIKCQDYINRSIPEKGIKKYYEAIASMYLHSYHANFLLYLPRVILNYPQIGFDLVCFTTKALFGKIKRLTAIF